MRATFRITEQDYVKALRLSSTKILFWLYVITAIIFELIFAILGIPNSNRTHGVFALGFIFITVSRYIISPIQWRRHYKKYKSIHEEVLIELLDEGIRFSSSNGEGKLTWDKILKWRKNNNYILIYQAPRIFQAIPTRINASGFDIALLSSRLSKHVGNPS